MRWRRHWRASRRALVNWRLGLMVDRGLHSHYRRVVHNLTHGLWRVMIDPVLTLRRWCLCGRRLCIVLAWWVGGRSTMGSCRRRSWMSIVYRLRTLRSLWRTGLFTPITPGASRRLAFVLLHNNGVRTSTLIWARLREVLTISTMAEEVLAVSSRP
jgi:hypothetical protein